MGKHWTEDEDKILTELVTKYGKQWGLIAEKMGNRSSSQVSARWEKCLDPKLTKGPFTEAEDQIIKDYVAKNGPQNWPGLSAILTNRSPKQCRERWYNHLNPDISSRPWTAEEDQQILWSVKTYGQRWSIIARMFPGRTDNAIKNRWNSSISKRIISTSNGMQTLAPDLSKRRKQQTPQIVSFPPNCPVVPVQIHNTIPTVIHPIYQNNSIPINNPTISINPPPIPTANNIAVPIATPMAPNSLPHPPAQQIPTNSQEKPIPHFKSVAIVSKLPSVNTTPTSIQTNGQIQFPPSIEFHISDPSPNQDPLQLHVFSPSFTPTIPYTYSSENCTPIFSPSGQSQLSNMFK